MEESIDGILHKFDRKSIRSFLKRDINGNAKKQTHLSDIVRGEPAVSAVHRPHTALGREGIHYQGADADPMPGRFMEVGPRPNSSAEHGRKVAKARATRSRAAQSAGGVGYIQDSISEDKGGFLSTSIRESKSAGATTTGVLSESKSLPVLSPRRGRLGSEEQSVLADIKVKSLFPAEEMGEGAAEPGLHQPFLPSVHDNGLPGLPGDTLIQVPTCPAPPLHDSLPSLARALAGRPDAGRRQLGAAGAAVAGCPVSQSGRVAARLQVRGRVNPCLAIAALH